MKKLISVLLAAIMLVSAFTVGAAAVNVNAQGNGRGVQVCGNRFENAKYKAAEIIVESANRLIEKMVEVELKKDNPNISQLVWLTDKIAAEAIFVAGLLGVEVVCEYTRYEYNGIVFYIDPLIVIRR